MTLKTETINDAKISIKDLILYALVPILIAVVGWMTVSINSLATKIESVQVKQAQFDQLMNTAQSNQHRIGDLEFRMGQTEGTVQTIKGQQDILHARQLKNQ